MDSLETPPETDTSCVSKHQGSAEVLQSEKNEEKQVEGVLLEEKGERKKRKSSYMMFSDAMKGGDLLCM